MTSLLDHFASAVESHPDRVAIVDGQGRETTFLELQRRSRALAVRWYSKGIRHGDRVLLAMPVNANLYASLAALWSLGATVVLPEPAMGLGGLRHAAQVTTPKAICASGPYAFLKYMLPELWGKTLLKPRSGTGVPPPVTISECDIALISFTSGTTGIPKASH
jgi:acyl-coenzyme A synthetase/AMP-(fatty) acid ligase